MIIVGECLKACAFTNGEVADTSVFASEHVLAAGNAVDPRLDSFRWLIQRTSIMAGVRSGARLGDMVEIEGRLLRVPFRIGKVANCIPDREPGSFDNEEWKDSCRRSWERANCSCSSRNSMPFPISATLLIHGESLVGMCFHWKHAVEAEVATKADNEHAPSALRHSEIRGVEDPCRDTIVQSTGLPACRLFSQPVQVFIPILTRPAYYFWK